MNSSNCSEENKIRGFPNEHLESSLDLSEEHLNSDLSERTASHGGPCEDLEKSSQAESKLVQHPKVSSLVCLRLKSQVFLEGKEPGGK